MRTASPASWDASNDKFESIWSHRFMTMMDRRKGLSGTNRPICVRRRHTRHRARDAPSVEPRRDVRRRDLQHRLGVPKGRRSSIRHVPGITTPISNNGKLQGVGESLADFEGRQLKAGLEGKLRNYSHHG